MRKRGCGGGFTNFEFPSPVGAQSTAELSESTAKKFDGCSVR